MSGFFLRRNPSFLLIWIGQILSQSGGRMYQMAMIWWILQVRPESPGKFIGIFMVLAALPSILLVKWIGDRVDRAQSQIVLVVCDLLAANVILLVAFLLYKEWMPFAGAFVAGIVAALLQAHIDPTLNKSVEEVVPKEDVEGAVAFLTSTQSVANFAGAVMGAMLIEKMGIAGTATLAALGYLVSSMASGLAKFQFRREVAVTKGEEASGWALLNGYPLLKKILIGFGLINFFATPTLVVLPLYAKQTLGGTAATLGWLEAYLWLGLLGGSAVAKFVKYPKDRLMLGACCLAVFAIGLGLPGAIVQEGLYRVSLFVAGLALGVNNVKFVALFQETVAQDIKGRFFALMQGILGFTFPVAYFFFGSLCDYLSPPQVCLIQGVGVLLLSSYFVLLSRTESRGLAWQS